MTGQAQTQGMSAATFKQQVCNTIYGLFDCANGVYVDVQDIYRRSPSVTITNPIDANGNFSTTNFGYQARRPRRHRGGAAVLQVAGLRVAARLQSVQRQRRLNLLVATAVFRNEPYASS